MYVFSICMFQRSKTREYVLLAFLPGGRGLSIVVNGPSTNRKLIWQELTDVVEIRGAWSILKMTNPANREIKFQSFGAQEHWYTESKRNKAFSKRIYLQRDTLPFGNSTHKGVVNVSSNGAKLKH